MFPSGPMSISFANRTALLVTAVALLAFLSPLPLGAGACTHEIMGYYPSWTRWDPFLPADIDWSQVTIVNHAFLEVLSDGTLAEDADYAFTRPLLISEAHASGALVLASLGGWAGCTGKRLQAIAAEPGRRAGFARNLRDYCVASGYDGATLDWEFPGARWGDESGCVHEGKNASQCITDRTNFRLLAQEIRARFDEVIPPLLLSVALPSTGWYGECYDGPGIADAFDYLEIMAYDMHGDWEGHVGHNAQLFEPPGDPHGGVLSCEGAVDYWTATQGLPAGKVLLGVPFYGYGYPNAEDLYDADVSGMTSHTYAGLVENTIGQGWTRHWDPDALAPYLRRDAGPGVISYDDPQSLDAKVAWGVPRGLAGFMIWELSQDYFPATGEHPLQDALGGPLCGGAEEDCGNGIDDDGDTLTDCDDPDCEDDLGCCLRDPARDCDGDTVVNAGDCAPDDGGAHAVPDRAGPLTVAKTGAAAGAVRVSWPGLGPQAGRNTFYDLAGGLLSEIGPGLPAAGCLSDNFPGTTYTDDRAVGGGATDGFWYLVRGQNICGQGPYGRTSLEGGTVCD